MTAPRATRFTALLAWACLALALAGCDRSNPAPENPPHSPTTTTTTGPAPGSPAPTTASRSPSPVRLHVTTLAWRLPQPVGRETAVIAAQGSAVVAGGLVAGDASTGSAYRLDLGNGTVTRLPALAIPVHDAASVVADGDVLVIGGGNSAEQDVEQAMGSRRWRVVARLPSPRSDLSAVEVAGHVYVVGGYDGSTPALPDVLDGGATRGPFQTIGRLQVGVRYAAVAAVDDSLWVFGGERDGRMLDIVQRVDLRTGKTAVVARLPHPLGEAAAVVLRGEVLLIGGRTSAKTLTGSLQWFDPQTLQFRSAGRLPRPLADAAAVTSGGTAYVLGGETPHLSNRVIRLSALP